MNAYGGIALSNSGTISNCSVKGNISGSYDDIGGICAYNRKNVLKCKFEGNIKNTSSGSYYTGGICGYNDTSSSTVSDCYFIGNIESNYYMGGIVGHNYYSSRYGSIRNCYAVPTFTGKGYKYGIYYANGSGGMTSSYYDKAVSGLADTTYGTPKSTAAMKMKKTYTDGGWDFEAVWGIDKSINNGYPYLLWEYPDVEAQDPYTVNDVKIKDLSGNEVEEIPEGSFYFEMDVTKNDNSKTSDSVIIAVYDENGIFIEGKYMSGIYNQNQTVTFGTMINSRGKTIGDIKGFVWNSISGMVPLSNSLGINN